MCAQNSWNNTVGTATDDTVLNQIRSQSGQWVSYNDQTDTFGEYNFAGDPNGNVTANTGSLCRDTTNGELYVKQSDASNTDWALVGVSSNHPILQVVTETSTAHVTTTSAILVDNSTPQIGEGASFDTLTITPTDASSVIFIEFNTFCSVAAGAGGVVALFRQPTADALKGITWGEGGGGNSQSNPVTIQYLDSPATTSPVTYEIRFGPSSGGIQAGLNGGAAGISAIGNAAISNFRATEFNPSFSP